MKRISDEEIITLTRHVPLDSTYSETPDEIAFSLNEVIRLLDAQLSADKDEEEHIREDESKAIIRCVQDCIRVQPDWDMPRLLELLEFREETRQAIKKYHENKEEANHE